MVYNESLELHNELNPKLWNNYKLKDGIRDKIIEIVNEFINFVEIPLKPVDIYILGSNASYNYTNNSDIDVHIVANFNNYESSEELMQILFNSERSRFNSSYDISIKGLNVELYVEDIRANTISNGIYSIYKDDWIKLPKRINNPNNDYEVETIYNDLLIDINNIINNSNDVEELKDIIDRIYLMRKESLSTEGEFGAGNLAFKELRNNGYIDKINNKIIELKSDELSIESVIRNILCKGECKYEN